MTTISKWSYVKAASAAEKAEMLAQIAAENEFQQQEPHGHDEDDNDCPIVFRLENHDGYQMQPYTPSGHMMDSSYAESFIRCHACGHITTLGGEPEDEQWCTNDQCNAIMTEYYYHWKPHQKYQ